MRVTGFVVGLMLAVAAPAGAQDASMPGTSPMDLAPQSQALTSSAIGNLSVGEAARQSGSDGRVAHRPSPSRRGASASAASSFTGRCLLEIHKTRYIDGRCPISTQADGGFTIGAAANAPLTYFAMVLVNGRNVGEGYWNEDKRATHAHTPLGTLTRQGACWQNSEAKVCAWK